MGEFKDHGLWMKLSFLMVMLGFIMLCFAFAINIGAGGGNGAEACLIVGFLCFVTACVLVLILTYLDEVKGSKPAMICLVIFALIAGIAVVIGVAIAGGNNSRNSIAVGVYSSMVGAFAGLFAILGGIFAILELVGVKAG